MKLNLLVRATRVVRDAERGVSAVILALTLLVMMGSAALGFDIATLAYVKQVVRNSVDSAAQIGAEQLDVGGDVNSAADLVAAAFKKAYAGNYTGWGNYAQNLPQVSDTSTETQDVLKISFLCIVAKPGSSSDPTLSAEADSICDMASYVSGTEKCSDVACAIPCPASATCNGVSVSANVTVNYAFAPAININSGETGSVTTLACACGDPSTPNPMNVVVMADRTPSMFSEDGAKVYNSATGRYDGDRDLNSLKSGIQSMLKVMSPVQQYVAFGAIHKSLPKVSSGDLTTPPGPTDNLFTYTSTSSDQYTNKVTSITSTICTASGYYWKDSNSSCYKTATYSNQITSITISNTTICTAAGYTWSSNSCYKKSPYTSANKVTSITTITSAVCTAAGDYWKTADSKCYTTAAFSNQITSITSAICTAAGYYWSSDNLCYQNKTTTTTSTRNDLFNGTWVPVAFSNNYLNAAGTDLNTNTDLYKSVTNLTYSNATTSSNGKTSTSYKNADGYAGNTHLAAAMKGAARYLLGKDPNNIATLDAVSKRPDTYGTPRNVIIFETDGSPSESSLFTNAKSTTADALKLDNPDDLGNSDGEQACKNFDQVAQYAKDAGITIITIGFGDAASASNYCSSANKTKTSAALAAAASPVNGVASTADKTCANENTDGDNYYCAANGSDLKNVFRAALRSLGGGTRFMAIPGVGN